MMAATAAAVRTFSVVFIVCVLFVSFCLFVALLRFTNKCAEEVESYGIGKMLYHSGMRQYLAVACC